MTEEHGRFTLQVQPSQNAAGRFEWTIRENGRLLERSDRLAPSEEKALTAGRAALERLLTPALARR